MKVNVKNGRIPNNWFSHVMAEDSLQCWPHLLPFIDKLYIKH